MRIRRALMLVSFLLLLASCSSNPPAAVNPSLTSPAPSDAQQCLKFPVRAEPLEPSQLVTALDGHEPQQLPDGFGLVGVWGDDSGSFALWGDANCRTIGVETWYTPQAIPSGTPVGSFTLVSNKPPTCASSGPKPCYAFQAELPPGLVEADVVGLGKAATNAVVRSIK